MPVPQPDISTSLDLVRTLLRTQAPFLADLPLQPWTQGRSHALFSVGDGMAVRLPRTEEAAAGIAVESRWLEMLSESLPAAVPSPVFVGRPTGEFPWPWSVAPRLRGSAVASTPRHERGALAEDLANFFACLHQPAPEGSPRHVERSLDLDDFLIKERVRMRFDAWSNDAKAALTERWTTWSRVPSWERPATWIHGNVHPLTVLSDDRGRLAGVVHWENMGGGDPAVDLASAWLIFHAPDRERFVNQTLDPYDAHVWTRAKAWALYLALDMATNAEIPELIPLGEETLAELAVEPVA